MYKTCSIVATVGFIGLIRKGGGTIAAAFAAAIWYFFMTNDFYLQIISVTLVFALGVLVSNYLDHFWGKDSSKIVIDEVLGMMVSVLFLPITLEMGFLGFLLFRFFDITKILGIRSSEKLPKGWGVMVDDLWAGLYSNIILQILLHYNLF